MTLARATYRGRAVVVARFEKIGDGERCGFARHPLYPHTRNIAGVLKRTGRGLAYVLCGGFPVSGTRSGVRESQGFSVACEHPVHAAPSFSLCRAFQPLQKSARGLFHCFQFVLSAGSGAGSIAPIDGHDHGERKMKCPTKALKDLTK